MVNFLSYLAFNFLRRSGKGTLGIRQGPVCDKARVIVLYGVSSFYLNENGRGEMILFATELKFEYFIKVNAEIDSIFVKWSLYVYFPSVFERRIR